MKKIFLLIFILITLPLISFFGFLKFQISKVNELSEKLCKENAKLGMSSAEFLTMATKDPSYNITIWGTDGRPVKTFSLDKIPYREETYESGEIAVHFSTFTFYTRFCTAKLTKATVIELKISTVD